MNDVELKGDFARTNMESSMLLKKEFEENGLSGNVNEIFCITDKDGNLLGTVSHIQTVSYSTAREIGFSVFEQENRNKGYASSS
jgi:predicted acetyltransferase